MCVSSNKKLLAVAERSEKAMITVYDLQTLKRRKVLMSSDANSKEYVSLSFSADGKMLLAQGGAPDYNVVLWVWEKSKVAAVAKTTNQQGSPVHSVSHIASLIKYVLLNDVSIAVRVQPIRWHCH